MNANFREFFSSNLWWGKTMGAVIGFLFARSVGALIGILFGNVLDHMLASYVNRPHWYYRTEKNIEVKRIFFETTFSLMGLIAKADGHVSPQAIQMAKSIMQELGLNRAQKIKAQHHFNEGKEPSFNLHQALLVLRKVLQHNPRLIKCFIDIQYQAAQIEGLTAKKQHVLNTMLKSLGFAPLHKQYQFYEDFSNYSSYQQEDPAPKQQRHTAYSTDDHAYAILNISTTAGKQEVKRAYRRLMSQYHPDKLIANKSSDASIKKANEKTQAISKAYAQICKHKGW